MMKIKAEHVSAFILLLSVTFAFLYGLINVMNQEEFIHVILPLKDRLFRIAWHIISNREEAEDIVQDVMIRIWRMEENIKEIENMEAYCYTMVRNLALNRLGLKANQHLQLEEGIRKIMEKGGQEEMETTERLMLLHRLMGQLSFPQRDIIQLRDVEGMSYGDIAVTLCLTEEQVKVYLFRARKKVRELYLKLEGYGL